MQNKLSICIPAYNRAAVLPELMDSIVNQDFDDFNIVICEDNSPERDKIRAIVHSYLLTYPGRIHYIENEKNLGYDANLRNLVANAQGEYCLFMGNDDLLCAGALQKVASALESHAHVGVIVRSYASFTGQPHNIDQTFRYFPEQRLFPAGPDSVTTVFRRSVVISGMVIHTESARRLATDRFDGTLLYQVYLVANSVVERPALFLPDILILYRNGGIPDFGHADVERDKFVPAHQTPASSLQFIQGMLHIALCVEQERGIPVYRRIVADTSHYSYPILAIQSTQPVVVFFKYWFRLSRMGLGRYPLLHLYFLALLLFGKKRMDGLIVAIKQRVGHTPTLGSLFKGKSMFSETFIKTENR